MEESYFMVWEVLMTKINEVEALCCPWLQLSLKESRDAHAPSRRSSNIAPLEV